MFKIRITNTLCDFKITNGADMDVVLSQEVIGKIKAGDQSVIDELIDIHMPLTYILAKRFCGHTRKLPDLKAEACLGLTQACHWIFESGRCGHDNYTAFIVQTIKNFITRYKTKDYLVSIPREDHRQRKAYSVYSIDELLGVEYHLDARKTSETASPKSEFNPVRVRHSIRPTHEDRLITESLYQEMRLTRLEQEIVYHLIQGRTVREIGTEVGISKSRVSQMVEGIRGKARFFKEQYNGKS